MAASEVDTGSIPDQTVGDYYPCRFEIDQSVRAAPLRRARLCRVVRLGETDLHANTLP